MTREQWLQTVLTSGRTSQIGQHLALVIYQLAVQSNGPVRASGRDLARLTGWGHTVIYDALNDIGDFVRVHWSNGRGKSTIELVGLTDDLTAAPASDPDPIDRDPTAGLSHHPDMVLVPKSIRYHPIVGFGLGSDPNGDENGSSRAEAFFWILFQAEVRWAGTLRAPYLTLRDGCAIRQNPARIWQWTTPFARKFVNAMAEHGLIDSKLCQNLLECVTGMDRIGRAPIPASTREAVLKKTKGKCAYCAVVLTIEPGHPHSYCADHVLPVHRGGSDDIANLIPSCRTCNGKKSAKTALQFMTSDDETSYAD